MSSSSSSYNNDKSIPYLRDWELNANSTRYDKNLAAPDDEQLVKYWYGWAVLALTAGIFVLCVFLPLVTSRKARKQSFNVYLMYLMIPDFVFSICCGITCLLNAVNGSYYSHWMCNFQQWYCVWGIGANCWLNALITYQLHSLLKCSQQTRRYRIPPPKNVTKHALLVYLYCAFLGSWGLFPQSTSTQDNNDQTNFPYHAIQISGLACIPVEADLASSLFFWLFFMPLFSLIPIFYVIYVAIDIWRRQLLPSRGKRRLLALYFGRIIIVFLVFWGPYFLLNYLLASVVPTWVIYVGGTLSHLQGPVSAGVSLMKPDIWHAVRRFWTCQCDWFREEDSNKESSSIPIIAVSDENNSSSNVIQGDESLVTQSIRTDSLRRHGFIKALQDRASRFIGINPITANAQEESGASESHPLTDPDENSYDGVWPSENGSYVQGADADEDADEDEQGQGDEKEEANPEGKEDFVDQEEGRNMNDDNVHSSDKFTDEAEVKG